MQAEAWIRLIKRIPPIHQDNLVIVTKFGREISIQAIARLDDDFILVRGRLAGTTDENRAYWVPFEEIGYLGFQRPVSEALLAFIYGEGPEPEVIREVEMKVDEAAPVESLPATAPEPEMVQLPSKSQAPERMPDKAALLKRIRERSQTNGSSRPDADQ